MTDFFALHTQRLLYIEITFLKIINTLNEYTCKDEDGEKKQNDFKAV